MALSPDMPLHDQLALFDRYVADVKTAQHAHPFLFSARKWSTSAA
jgi:hypothetical protein